MAHIGSVVSLNLDLSPNKEAQWNSDPIAQLFRKFTTALDSLLFPNRARVDFLLYQHCKLMLIVRFPISKDLQQCTNDKFL